MHPVLRLQNIEQAPPSYRNTLRDALRGGPRALSNLQTLERGLAGRAQPKHVLPVLYATLDPSPILDASSSDTPPPFPDSLLDRVLICIGILATMLEDSRVPSEAFSFIWPRLFDWVLFIENYHDSHPDLVGREVRRPFFVGFVMATAELVAHEPTRDMIEATPGFRTLIGRIWLSFPESWDDPDIPWHHLGILLMDNLLLQDPTNLRDFVAAFDGGESQLATFVIKHIAPASIEYVAPAMDVILKTQKNQRFMAILLDHGLIPALTRLVALYASQKDAVKYLVESFPPLSRPFEMPRALHWITQALKAGLLDAIVLAGTNYPNHAGTIEYLQWFLAHVLPRARVYLPAVVQISRTLEHAVSLAAALAFQKSLLFPAWKAFVAMAEDSLQYLAYYSRPDRPRSVQVCYNSQCLKVLPRKSTKRCPQCRLCHYCSEDCQRIDWLDGKHRRECGDLYSNRVASPDDLSARNRDFLRTIVEFEYMRDRGM
ncbi:hypothetical protein FB45DRAFT_932774 [Roridomyces roridus]|uniref:MYND-type domain-containing protein n=1 Tax=Roridomyces roridus TaxID=1738132 RepID=A0AAD7BDP7_9AGAR|nr:hypothetical protein FB45DRAFT_932774 [Roridomyces roridus]